MRRRYFPVWLRVVVLALLVLGVALGAITLAQRARVAEAYLRRTAASVAERPGWSLTYTAPQGTGWRSVRLDTLTLARSAGPSLRLVGLTLTPNLWQALGGNLALAAVALDSLRVDYPFDAPPVADTSRKPAGEEPRAVDFSVYHRTAQRLLGRLPGALTLRRGLVTLRHGNGIDTLLLNDLTPQAGGWAGTLALPNDTVEIYGGPRGGGYQLGWRRGSVAAWALPALEAYSGVVVGGNRGSLSAVLGGSGRVQLALAGENVSVKHPRLARGLVGFAHLQLTAEGTTTEGGIAIDSSRSRFALNGYTGYWGGAWQVRPDTALSFVWATDTLRANAVLDSLPANLAPNLQGLRVAGRFRQRLYASVGLSHGDTAIFEPTLWCDSCRVTRWGKANPLILNGTFTHRTYRENRALVLGPDNPTYTPLGGISKYVQHAVEISEDGGFYGHRGFYPQMMAKALAENLRQGRIVRGGSTISMQLVKNVFLTPDKTLSRKLEEAVLVWLIESQRLVPKARMLEVYLNLIEWGPGVYGAAQACQYYFNKPVGQVYFPEAIFLALVVPSPRNFRYHFLPSGQLKPYVAKYYDLILGHLERRGLLQPGERVGWNIETFRLTGPALRELGQTPDTTYVPDPSLELLDAEIDDLFRELGVGGG